VTENSLRRRVSQPTTWIGTAIFVLGVWQRTTGFTRGDLWFDDAWTALAGHVSFASSLKMSATVPLYTLMMHFWVLAGPHTSWWAQIPAFALSLATIPATYFFVRFFRVRTSLAFLATLIMAVSPIAVMYSTRVKEYNADILLSFLLLWLVERWRRQPQARLARWIALSSTVALLTSASLNVIVVPVFFVMMVVAWRAPEHRRSVVLSAGTVVIVGVAEYLLWLSHLSSNLFYGWRQRGDLLDYRSFHQILYSLQSMAAKFFYFFIGTPAGFLPDPKHAVVVAGAMIALITGLVLGAFLWTPVTTLLHQRGREIPPTLVAAVALLLNVALAFADTSPFGGGRTDEVIYPAMFVLAAVFAENVIERFQGKIHRGVFVALYVASTLFLLNVAHSNRALYPVVNLRNLMAQVQTHTQPGDLIAVDPWFNFTWALDNLSAYRISFAHNDWSQGYHIVSADPSVMLTTLYMLPDAAYGSIPHHSSTTRLWYVGIRMSPKGFIFPDTATPLTPTACYLALVGAQGWQPTHTYVVGTNTIAVLLTHAPTSSASVR